MNKTSLLMLLLLVAAASAAPAPDAPAADTTHDHVGHDAKDDHKHGDHTHHPGHEHVGDHNHNHPQTPPAAGSSALQSSPLSAEEAINQVVIRNPWAVREETDSLSNRSLLKLMTHIIRRD